MIRLHTYWRSSAAWRVRIALGLKGIAHDQAFHDLRTGAQNAPGYATLNPQRLVPALETDGQVLTQSLAILEWLDERHPAPPLLPADSDQRAIVRAMAMIVCCDIHPLNNLRVLNALRSDFGADDAAIQRWIARWIGEGFAALETMIARHGGTFAFGDAPTLADCCLVPQVFAARRFGVPLDACPRILAVAERCRALEAFAKAEPAAQPDAD